MNHRLQSFDAVTSASLARDRLVWITLHDRIRMRDRRLIYFGPLA